MRRNLNFFESNLIFILVAVQFTLLLSSKFTEFFLFIYLYLLIKKKRKEYICYKAVIKIE
jgi:hypothetical protein